MMRLTLPGRRRGHPPWATRDEPISDRRSSFRFLASPGSMSTPPDVPLLLAATLAGGLGLFLLG